MDDRTVPKIRTGTDFGTWTDFWYQICWFGTWYGFPVRIFPVRALTWNGFWYEKNKFRTTFRTNKNAYQIVPRTVPNKISHRKSVPGSVPYRFVSTVRPSMSWDCPGSDHGLVKIIDSRLKILNEFISVYSSGNDQNERKSRSRI